MRPARPVKIAAAALWLPAGRDSAAQAQEAGRLEPDTAQRLAYAELSVSEEHSGPELAALAARKAVADAGWEAEQIHLLAHAWLYHQGHDFWSPPHFVAHQLGARNALPVGVLQTSNGCAAAIEVVLGRMAADPTVTQAVVTTGDRFAGPGFDRWRSDFDVGYGDAGTALLLTTGEGPYSLLSVSSVAAPEFEILYRGDDPFSPAPRTHRDVIDARRTKAMFRESGQLPRFAAILRRSVQRVIQEAIAEAGIEEPFILALPRLGSVALRDFFIPPIDELGLTQLEHIDFGRDTGHLGAGDPTANLAVLQAANQLAPGQAALLLSVGNGHTWSCIAVRRD